MYKGELIMEKKFSLENLDQQGEDYKKEKSVNYSAYIYSYRFKVVKQRMRGPKVLEVGVGHADITNWLSGDDNFELVSIDGSKTVLEHAFQKISRPERVNFIHTYFEDFNSDVLFDDILITNSLEHVDNPVELLKHIKKFLAPGGRIHITVPNAMSIHRMLGKEMGMLESETSLNVTDIQVGHQRVYTVNHLKEDVLNAGLEVVDQDGIILKTLSNIQMNELIDTCGQKVIDGLFAVGRRLPDLACEIYFCCKVI
jgi:2-polyprenyl-3-methyl-5-hydroxy-6-metoxy-1,4-benzoquinol methylase